MCLFERENISVHEFHVGCHLFLRFCLLSDTPIRNVLIFNFTYSAVSSGKFSSCTVSCSAFSRSGLFLQCSDFVFHRHPHSAIKSSINYGGRPSIAKIIVKYFQTETQKKKPDSELEKHTFFTAQKNVVTHLFPWLISHDSSRIVHQG